MSARASFRLDNNNRKLFEFLNEDLPETARVPPTGKVAVLWQELGTLRNHREVNVNENINLYFT